MGQLTVNIGGVPQITLSINEAAVFETIERRFTAYAAKMHVTPSRCATEIIVARTQSVSTTGRSWHGPNSQACSISRSTFRTRRGRANSRGICPAMISPSILRPITCATNLPGTSRLEVDGQTDLVAC
jgi:hypothetical protein